MNLQFWLAVAGLICLGLGFLLPPLFRSSAFVSASGEQRNKGIVKQQLADLKQQLEQGLLTQDDYNAQQTELKLTLLDNLAETAIKPPASSQGRWLAIVLLISLPIGSLALYAALGDPDAPNKLEIQAQNKNTADNIESLIPKLVERLKSQPNDSEGWMALGQAYVYLQQFKNAAEAFAHLNQLKPDDPAVMLRYADALAMSRDGSLRGEPAELVFKVLTISPKDHTALWLAGMAKAEQGKYQDAANYWKALSVVLPPEAEVQQQITGMIQAAEAEIAKHATDSVAGTSVVEVHVSLDPKLTASTESKNTVFIYAQATNGPKMPLAIVKKQVSDLPVSVTLDDSMAMQPQFTLSKFKQVRIVARVSKSGDAMPQPGDYIGSQELSLDGGSPTLNITINQPLK